MFFNLNKKEEEMITAGIDSGRRIISVSYVEDGEEIAYKEYENSFTGYRDLEEDMRDTGVEVVCIEGHGDSSRQAAVYLYEKGYKIYEINPLMLLKLKESMTEKKTDHIDAYVCGIFPFIRKDMKPLVLSIRVQDLKRLVRLYEKISKQVVRYKNQLHGELHQVFGCKYREVFPRINRTSLAFFSTFSTPEDVKEADIEEIHEVLKAGGSCMYRGKYGRDKAARIKEVLTKGYDEELKLSTDVGGTMIKTLCRILISLTKEKEEIKRKIERYVEELYPGYREHFRGIRLSSLRFGQIMAEIQDIDRFPDDGHLASYAGQAPVQKQSGDRNMMKNKKKYYNRHLAHVIHLLACSNVQKGAKYHGYYPILKKKFKKPLRALKTIKRKLIRDLYSGLVNYSSNPHQTDTPSNRPYSLTGS